LIIHEQPEFQTDPVVGASLIQEVSNCGELQAVFQDAREFIVKTYGVSVTTRRKDKMKRASNCLGFSEMDFSSSGGFSIAFRAYDDGLHDVLYPNTTDVSGRFSIAIVYSYSKDRAFKGKRHEKTK
jgi:hypothetical protein